jgi:Bacterial capsule synthesis protein PGA_cap
MTPTRRPFPDACTPERLAGFLRVRAEGRPLRESIWNGLSYLRKYARARWTAPAEEVAHFDEQRRLLRWLAGREEQGVGLAAVGDLMWLRDSWTDFLSPEVLAYLNGHEVVLGNLESPVSRRFKVPGLLPDYFTYNSDPALVTSFRRPDGSSTFSALGTANNHCLDRGDAGLADTLDFLDAQGIPHSGVRRTAQEKPYVTFDRGGIRFGFYAACWGLNNPDEVRSSRHRIEVQPGLAPDVCHPLDLTRLREALEGMAADGAEFRVVALHWGFEFEFYPDPGIVRAARDVVRAGADLVLGTHPHVVQPLEVCFVNGYERRYLDAGAPAGALAEPAGCLVRDDAGVPRKALVVYSLGNFATAMYTTHCRTGLVLGLRVRRDAETGRIDWGRPEAQFVYNVRRDPATRKRRLVLLESYLRERERRGDRAAKLREMAGFLERHLFGKR